MIDWDAMEEKLARQGWGPHALSLSLQDVYDILNNWHHKLSLPPRGIKYKQKKKPRRHQRKKA